MKIVWVIGAGASKEAGYPLIRDFLDPKYLEYLEHRWDLALISRETTGHIRDDLAHFSEAGDDLNELMSRFLSDGDMDQVDRLNTYIQQLLEFVLRFHSAYRAVSYIDVFVQYLAASNSSVLTFNYDLLLEERLGQLYFEARSRQGELKTNMPPYFLGLLSANPETSKPIGIYGCGSGMVTGTIPPTGYVPVLKLHGSLGWFYCSKCHGFNYSPPIDQTVPFYRENSPSGWCPSCKATRRFHRLLVPPASDTRFPAWRVLDDVWHQAELELVDAELLIVAGYSLPPEDRRARALLSAFAKNHPTATRLVVDPVLAAGASAPYRDVLGEFVPYPKTFSTFVRDLNCFRTESLPPPDGAIPKRAREIFEQMMVLECRREGTPFPGVVLLGENADTVLAEDDQPIWRYRSAASIVGNTSSEHSAGFLSEIAQRTRPARRTRFCVEEVGGLASQAALDYLSVYLRDPRVIDGNWTPLLDDPIELVSESAMTAVGTMMLTSPQLDYSQSYIPLAQWGLSLSQWNQGLASVCRRLLALGDAVGVWNRLGSTRGGQGPELCASAELATSLELLGKEKMQNRSFSSALESFEQAVSLYRGLVAHMPQTFQSYLSACLVELSECRAHLGSHDKAVSAATEATAILRQLADAYPLRFSTALVESFHWLSQAQRATKQEGPSIATEFEAVEYCRLRAREDSEFKLFLLQSLLKLGTTLRAWKRSVEALKHTTEAVELCVCEESWQREGEHGQLGWMALALNRFGINLAILDRFDDALTASRASVSLYLRAFDDDPYQVESQLAQGLNNIRIHLTSFRRMEEADAVQAAMAALNAYFVECRLRGNAPESAKCRKILRRGGMNDLAFNDVVPSAVLEPVRKVLSRFRQL